MGNQHTKKKETEAAAAAAAAAEHEAQAAREAAAAAAAEQEAQAARDAAAAELKVRATIRVTIHRLDGTVDEFVQALPKMRRGEAVQIIVTPEA